MASVAPVQPRTRGLGYCLCTQVLLFGILGLVGLSLTDQKMLGCQSQDISLSRWAAWDYPLSRSENSHSHLLCSTLWTCQKGLSWSYSCRFSPESWSNLKQVECSWYPSLPFPELCLGVFSCHLLALMVHQRHGQAASVFCLLIQAPGFLSPFLQWDREYVV